MSQAHIPVTSSSGNVFADLGLPEPEELLAKAALVRQISAAISERGLTQAQAAEIWASTSPRCRLCSTGV